MAKKFRKVYLILEDSNVFSRFDYESVNIYRRKEDAERMCELKQKQAIEEAAMMWNEGKPVQQYRVHGFWLIHEAWFSE